MEYQLQQTGQQVQDILNQAPTTEQNLQSEITRSTEKDQELESAIATEKQRAEGVESELQTAIGNEVSRAEGAEGNLQTAIATEKSRAEGVEAGLRTDVDGIESKIPTGASSENKLATEGFVNSSIATNTAEFKGTFPSLEALQTEVQDANQNDYAFVVTTDQDGNVTYSRYKYVTGTGWVFEYALNNSSFTAAQWAAIQSGITTLLVAKLAGLPTVAELTQQLNAIIDSVATEKARAEGAEAVLRSSIATNAANIVTEKNRAEGVEGTLTTGLNGEILARQNADTTLQQNIDAEATLRDNADDALQDEIDAINAKIPTQASASNQLADKAFVNSSIATNTGEFKGTYNSLAELQAVTNVNANDYGFVIATDGTGNTVYNRYKYVTGQGWQFEYALNNSSFTAAQWGAINSGITAALSAKINGLPDIDALNAMFAAITSKIPANASSSNKLVDYAQLVAALAAKQDTLIFDNVPTENSNNPVKSGGVYSAIATVTAAVVGLQSSKQDVLTFDQYPTPGSDNPVRSTGIYSAIENAVAPKANQTDLDNAVIRISTNEVDIAQLQAAYRGLTQNYVVPVAPTDTWPVANPQQNVIYRVTDRTHTPPQYYTDYMWNGTVMVLMAQYNNAIDSRPKKDSQNLVTSGGVFDNMGALDVSELNATENPHTIATYADLSAALAAIPSDYQKGGMSIKFVQSSDNKYVQFRYMSSSTAAADFTNVANWQGVDDVPTAGSNNLVKSGGILNPIYVVSQDLFANAEYGKFIFTDGYERSGDNVILTPHLLNLAGKTIIIQSNNGSTIKPIASYNESGIFRGFLGALTGSSTTKQTIKVPNDVYSIRIWTFTKQSGTAISFFAKKLIQAEDIENHIINWDKFDWNLFFETYRPLYSYKNIYDKDSLFIKKNYYRAYNTGVLIPNSDYECAMFLLKEGQGYFISGGSSSQYHVCFYNKDTYLSGSLVSRYFTVPANCNIVYISLLISDSNTFQVELGDIATPYTPYGFTENVLFSGNFAADVINGLIHADVIPYINLFYNKYLDIQGLPQSRNGDVTTDFIDCSFYKAWNLKYRTVNNSYIVFGYNSSKEFVRKYSPYYKTTGDTIDVDVVFGDDISYFRFFSYLSVMSAKPCAVLPTKIEPIIVSSTNVLAKYNNLYDLFVNEPAGNVSIYLPDEEYIVQFSELRPAQKLNIKNGWEIYGNGIDKTIIKYTATDEDFVDNWLDVTGSSKIHDLTIKNIYPENAVIATSQKLGYCLHVDINIAGLAFECERVKLVSDKNSRDISGDYIPGLVLGVGTWSEQNIKFKNCIFETNVLQSASGLVNFHNGRNSGKPCTTIFDNCYFGNAASSLHITENGLGVDGSLVEQQSKDNVIVSNCVLKSFITFERISDSRNSFNFNFTGTKFYGVIGASNVCYPRYAYYGVQSLPISEQISFVKNVSATDIGEGKLVKASYVSLASSWHSQNQDMGVQIEGCLEADENSIIYGVAVLFIINGKDGHVLKKGVIKLSSDYTYDSGLVNGGYCKLASGGTISASLTPTNMIYLGGQFVRII